MAAHGAKERNVSALPAIIGENLKMARLSGIAAAKASIGGESAET